MLTFDLLSYFKYIEKLSKSRILIFGYLLNLVTETHLNKRNFLHGCLFRTIAQKVNILHII